ncbi:unnamed protein product, partial [Discosporangium mesarthrocarpum]
MSTTPRRRGDEGEHGWPQSNVVEDVRAWFYTLTAHERLQAIAVHDVIWIRLFSILYRRHKSWMRQGGRPSTWDRDKVQKIYDKLHRNEMNRSGTGAGAGGGAGVTSGAIGTPSSP